MLNIPLPFSLLSSPGFRPCPPVDASLHGLLEFPYMVRRNPSADDPKFSAIFLTKFVHPPPSPCVLLSPHVVDSILRSTPGLVPPLDHISSPPLVSSTLNQRGEFALIEEIFNTRGFFSPLTLTVLFFRFVHDVAEV